MPSAFSRACRRTSVKSGSVAGLRHIFSTRSSSLATVCQERSPLILRLLPYTRNLLVRHCERGAVTRPDSTRLDMIYRLYPSSKIGTQRLLLTTGLGAPPTQRCQPEDGLIAVISERVTTLVAVSKVIIIAVLTIQSM